MTNETEAPEAELSARLRANCVGQPAEIAWPHRILHEAANALDAQAARIAELEAENREMAMQCLASDGQAHDAYDRQKELKAKLASWQAAQHYSYIGIDGKQVRAVDLENRAIKAEAKLEMVTRGLEFIGCDDGPEGRHARATLAELKGGKDE